MVTIYTLIFAVLHTASIALGHPGKLDARGSALAQSLPPSASYNYLLSVKRVLDLGALALGGEQLLGDILDGQLYSEPGFEPSFSGKICHAEDYLTSGPDRAYARPSFVMTVVPDNGFGKRFLMRITGVQKADPSLDVIFAGGTTGLQVPYRYSYSGM
ncbi:hypothetical protein LTR62_004362 [Meristemomyces frigidus]|uniref:Uncharacterized protein n=1 Tax=Meristemomyces frigidus TaxID=1508187 RepID=A0AAN7TIP1_9PEZI|nr:hypothetical protein LTR62_004362 [Meristemomyces frigidus]